MVIGDSRAIKENLVQASEDENGHVALKQTEWFWISHCPSLSFYDMFWSFLGGILPHLGLLWPS